MKTFILAGVVCVLLLPGFVAGAGLELCLQGGAGYTVVDIPAATGYSSGDMNDWDEFHWRGALQGWFSTGGRLSFGFELGLQQQYYYYFRIFDGSTYSYPSNTVTPTTVLAMLEYRLSGGLALQGGLGGWFYESGTAMGIGAALVYSIPLSTDRATV